jgi:hypothetical protein
VWNALLSALSAGSGASSSLQGEVSHVNTECRSAEEANAQFEAMIQSAAGQ